MKRVVLSDLSDLPDVLSIWIYGAGDVGEKLFHLLTSLSGLKFSGFLDTFKQGQFCGHPIYHPDALEGSLHSTVVMLATQDEIAVCPILEKKGVATVYRFDPEPLLREMAQTTNLHYLPEALTGEKALIPISAREALIRASAAKLLVKQHALELGYHKLRKLAMESGWIHVEDDIAGCAFRQSSEQHVLVKFWDAAVRRGLLPGEKLRQQQDRAIERGLPPVLINTMLKSGTGYLTKVLTEKFSLPQYFITLRGSPNDWLLPSYLAQFAKGGAVSVQHMDASPDNLDQLAAAGIRKIYLHIRDPRQATVSYLHHLENNLVGDLYALRNWIQPFLPGNYTELSWSQKVDWHARNHVPGLIQWLQEWLFVVEHDSRFEILLIDFNRFRQDEAGAINEVLAFFGIDERISTGDLPDKKNVPHFRSGQSEEWRSVFTKRQQAIMHALMPAAWFDRFGWERY